MMARGINFYGSFKNREPSVAGFDINKQGRI